MNRVKHIVQSWRYYLVLALLLLASMVLVIKVASLQVVGGLERGHEFLKGQGIARTLRTETIPAGRGMIRDRNGHPLAISTPVISICGNPKLLVQHREQWPALAKGLDISLKELSEKIDELQDKEFLYLQRRMAPDQAEQVLQLGITGVFSQREYQRFYPEGEVTGHLLGFTDIDDRGQEGIELAFDDALKGHPGARQVIKDLKGRVVKGRELLQAAEPGQDLDLSIDLRIQYLAYRELKAAVKKHRADSGSIVVLDVASGEILAMANQPSFNPNNRSDIDPASVRNRAITDLFEPGSTVKPLTIMAALESGRYKPDTPINTNPGHIRVGGKVLLDPVNYGMLTVAKVLAKSSQVGASKIALSLDGHDIRDVFYRVGLGQDTGLGLPGEGIGQLPDYPKWKQIDQAAFGFGHGLSVTPLQLARAYAVLAADGIRRPVSIFRNSHAEGEQVLQPEYVAEVQEMLHKVTEQGGTGTKAQVDAYRVAGKTGTTHKISQSGGYKSNEYISIFAGMAPLDDPRIVTVVLVNNPKGNEYYGGEVAAPVFSNVVGGSLRLLNVLPDEQSLLAHAPGRGG